MGQEEEIFLDLNQGLWPAPNDKSSKLAKGKYSWPFTFTLPNKVSPPNAKGITLATPPSFSERASPAYIDYRLTATVKRGAFKVNQTSVSHFCRQTCGTTCSLQSGDQFCLSSADAA